MKCFVMFSLLTTFCLWGKSCSIAEYLSTALWEWLCGNTCIMMYEYGEFHTFLGNYMQRLLENSTPTEFRSHLHFVSICGEKYIQHLMSNITDFDKSIGQDSLLRHFSTWLIVSHDPPPHLNVTLDNVALINLEIPEISSVPFFSPTPFKEQVCVKQVHTLLWTPGGREWSRVHPCDVSPDRLFTSLFPNTLNGLNGRQIILSTLEWVPFVERVHTDSGRIQYVGSGIEMMELLKARFNFSYVIVEPQDKEWGRELKNGTWTGVIGMLHKQEADMCPVLYAMSKDRRKVIDYSTPLDATPFSAVYRRDSGEISPWSYLLTCFSWEVYLCGSVSMLWFVFLFEYIHRQKEKTLIASSVEVVFRAPLRQGVIKIPGSSYARILLSTWCVFCLVMTVIYTGNLVAFTTVDKYKPPFTTLMELADNDDYGLGVYEGTYIKEILTNGNCTVCKALNQKLLKSNIDRKQSTDDELRKRLAEEKFVLLIPKESEDVVRSMTCDVVTMKQRIFPVHSGYIFPKYSALRKLFDEQLAVLKDSAIFDQLVSKWTPAALKCYSRDTRPWLTLDHLKASIVACASGIFVATVVLVLEKTFHRCNPWT